MKNPHLKLGDTSRFVKHLIRALQKHCTEFLSIRPPWVTAWPDVRLMREARYKNFTRVLEGAMYLFQEREGLPRTGECDAATWAALERFL